MANVNQINETVQPMAGQVQNKPKTGEKSNAFETLLAGALDKPEAPEGGTPVSALGEIAATGFNLESPASLVTGKTDALLSLMDDYASQLGNPDVSLKSIAPVLEKMNADADALIKDTRFLNPEENELKSIATQTAVAAQTEYLKFQRGDYLS
jgi:hypothetical protein